MQLYYELFLSDFLVIQQTQYLTQQFHHREKDMSILCKTLNARKLKIYSYIMSMFFSDLFVDQIIQEAQYSTQHK